MCCWGEASRKYEAADSLAACHSPRRWSNDVDSIHALMLLHLNDFS
jgi:hypothetical protein